MLMGHGSGEGAQSKVNLPGPDATAAEYASWLGGFGKQQVVFVNAATGSDTTGNGTLSTPFATLTKAATVDAANHKIYVASGTYAGTGITLESGEWLIGQSSGGGTFDAFMLGFTPTSDTPARPILDGTPPSTVPMSTHPVLSGGTVITLAAGNTIRGVDRKSVV